MRGTWSLFFRGNAADMERLSAGVDGLADDVRYQSIWTSWKNAEFRYSDGIVTRIASEYRTGAIDGIQKYFLWCGGHGGLSPVRSPD